jgi:hypothetical protein
MDTKRHWIAALIACSLPLTANAYYLETRGETTEPMRWADGDTVSAETVDVEYRINTSSFPAGVTGIEEAIHAAFMTWTDAECATIDFTAGATTDSVDFDHWTTDGDERYILIYFEDNPAQWTAGPSVGTFYFGFSLTGEVMGATIILNSYNHTWATDGTATAMDVQSIVTALIGRSMGITSVEEGNATRPSYEPGDTSKRTLGTDDLAAVQYLYLGTGCAAPAEPVMICPETDPIGGGPCPPGVVTMPGDAGMGGVRDAGMTQSDAGMSDVDAGPMTMDDGGCSCRAAGSRTDGAAASIAAIALALVTIARRRKR